MLAFDKTGTLTAGRAHVVDIESDGVESDEVLARAAGLERHSEHGFACAITAAAATRGIEAVVARNIRVIPGRGIQGVVEGQAVAAGNAAMMGDLGWSLAPSLCKRGRSLEEAGYSVIYVGWGERVRGVLSLEDTLLPEACSTINALRSRGLHMTLLTGDLEVAAKRVAASAGIDDVKAALSPEAKRVALKRYRTEYDAVAMVGDGLNDGPVLADADVGIAVGSATDLARETAAVVLPPGGLSMLPWVIDVARAVRANILTNLMWAFGYNVTALTLAALGLLQPVLAAAVMAGSSILVVLNSLRLERLSDPVSSQIPERASGAKTASGIGVQVALGPAIGRS